MFGWREPLQILVGPDVVVENSEFIERALQCPATWNNQLPEQWLERAKQTLDPAVLPRRVFLGGLVPDTNDLQEGVEQPTVEHRFVVGAQLAGFAVLGNGQAHMPQHGPTAASGEHLKAQRQSAAVVDDANGRMGCFVVVGEERHVHGPCVVDCDIAGFGRSDLTAQLGDLLLVAGNQIGHKGFPNTHAGMQALEGVGHSAATRSGHVGFEAQDFKAQPVGFAAGVLPLQCTDFWASCEGWCLRRVSKAKKAFQAVPYLPRQVQNFAEYQAK